MLNLEQLSGLGGSTIPVRDLVELNKALRASGVAMHKASSAGYPSPQGGSFSSPLSGDFAPLVPQSIQNVLDSATFTESMIQFWKRVPKTSVAATVHESVVINSHGSMNLDPFISEGGRGTRSLADYARKVVKVKYLAEEREISDVATMVGTIGSGLVSKQGLAMETQAGTMALMGKLERSLFFANSNVSELHFDGLYQQLTQASYADLDWNPGASNYEDKAGAAFTVNDLIDALYKQYSAPNFGAANTILVEPRTYAALQAQATAYGRFTMSDSAVNLTFAQGQLSIAGPAGAVPIVGCPLLLPPQTIDANGLGATVPATPVILDTVVKDKNTATGHSGFQGTEANTPNRDSKFTAAQAGTYRYKVVAVTDSGVSAPVESAAVSIAAGQYVSIGIDDGGVALAGAGGPRYYRVYRLDPGASEYKFLQSFPQSGSASNDSQIMDGNANIAGTAPVFLLQNTPDVLQWVQLLDFLRRPLAQDKTTVPFLLMLFGALHVKVPTKNYVLDNVKLGV